MQSDIREEAIWTLTRNFITFPALDIIDNLVCVISLSNDFLKSMHKQSLFYNQPEVCLQNRQTLKTSFRFCQTLCTDQKTLLQRIYRYVPILWVVSKKIRKHGIFLQFSLRLPQDFRISCEDTLKKYLYHKNVISSMKKKGSGFQRRYCSTISYNFQENRRLLTQLPHTYPIRDKL